MAKIDRDLRSLRLTFGVGLIILTILLAFAAPGLVSRTWNPLPAPTESSPAPTEAAKPAAEAPAPVATTTAATTTAATAR